MYQDELEPLVPQLLQRQMTQTPTGGGDPDDTGRLGFYVVHDGHDLGYCEGLQMPFTSTKQDLQSRREAVRKVVKSRVSEFGATVTFVSRSIRDTENIAIWNLSAQGGVKSGPMVITMPSDEGEQGLTVNCANVDLRVTSGFDGEFAQDYMGYAFEGTVTEITGEDFAKLALIAAAGG